MTAPTLAEFLLTRITEDEAGEDAQLVGSTRKDWSVRWAAECKAKRHQIDMAFDWAEGIDGEWGDGCSADKIRRGDCSDHGASYAHDHLVILAAVYADHPDFDQAWRA